jgi:hypothetical protein
MAPEGKYGASCGTPSRGLPANSAYLVFDGEVPKFGGDMGPIRLYEAV